MCKQRPEIQHGGQLIKEGQTVTMVTLLIKWLADNYIDTFLSEAIMIYIDNNDDNDDN